MEAALLARLEELRERFRECAVRMADLDAAQQRIREEMLRISGAAEVLEELLAGPGEDRPDVAVSGAGPAADRPARP